MKQNSAIKQKRIMGVFVGLFSLLHVLFMSYMSYKRYVFYSAAEAKTDEMKAYYLKVSSISPTLENVVIIISVLLFIALAAYILYAMPSTKVAICGITLSIVLPIILLIPFNLSPEFGLGDTYFVMLRGLIYGAIIIACAIPLYFFRKSRAKKI